MDSDRQFCARPRTDFAISKEHFKPIMSVPYWVQDAIFYQIFPDRFFNGDPGNDPPNVQPWGAKPTLRGFQGGDLRGIIEKFDYLLDLGINALYLNPIHMAASNHRYNATDYFQIDPSLGTMEDFKALLAAAHGNNARVILDGVFNHVGRGFFAFTDVLENGPESRYKDWFYINNFPLEAYEDGSAVNYQAWWEIKDLPKLNVDNPAVRSYIMGVVRYWLELGSDGWRLDVPGDIQSESFWAEFRQVVKGINPDAYTVGEIWEENPGWVGEGRFDGLMHYPLREAILGLLGGEQPVAAFADRVEGFWKSYPRENLFAMLLPMSSHDTRRLMTRVEGSQEKAKLAFLLQFTHPGAPCVYYGDEVGLEGEKDPDNRRAFPWNEKAWNIELRDYVKKLTAARKRLAALRRGDLARVYLSEENSAYAYARLLGEETVLVAVNASGETRHLGVPVKDLGWEDGRVVADALNPARYGVRDGVVELTLGPWSGVILD